METQIEMIQTAVKDFGLSADEKIWPIIKASEVVHSEDGPLLSLHMTISPELTYFKGHFPQQAVLPGVVQQHWAVVFSKRFFSVNTPFRSVNNLKFLTMIFPGQELTLQLKLKEQKQSVNFNYLNGSTQFSEGRIAFGEHHG